MQSQEKNFKCLRLYSGAANFSNVFVERKSLSDFIGTVIGGGKRFQKEIDIAKKMGAYMVVLVECDLEEALEFKPPINSQQFYGGKVAFSRMRNIMQSNHNIQFLFVKDRKEASEKVVKILTLGEPVKNTDLQYFYDLKQF